jgi:hypothetical protein
MFGDRRQIASLLKRRYHRLQERSAQERGQVVTYVALAVAALSSIVATFIKPTTKRGEFERLNRWSILFVLLPLAAFVAGALDTRSKDQQTESA